MKTHTQLTKRFFAALLFSTIVLVFPNSPAANSLDDGIQAYEAGDYKKAFDKIKPLAEQGVVSEQMRIPPEFTDEEMESLFDIPQETQREKDIKSFQRQRKLFSKAAEQGDADAQILLGITYYYGQGVTQDYAEAVKWYRKAAEQGNPYAQNHLGVMYERNKGVPQDYIEAHKWYNLAASHFPGDDQKLAQKNRDIVEKKMTPAQVAEAQKLAREWKPKPNK